MTTIQGFLQLVQNESCNKVFVAVQQGRLCLFHDDPQKTDAAPFHTVDLRTARLSENASSQRPKSFALTTQSGALLEFACATNSVRSSWVKSLSEITANMSMNTNKRASISEDVSSSHQGLNNNTNNAHVRLRGLLSSTSNNMNSNTNTSTHAAPPMAMPVNYAPQAQANNNNVDHALPLPRRSSVVLPLRRLSLEASPAPPQTPQNPLLTQQYPPTPFVSAGMGEVPRERERERTTLRDPVTANVLIKKKALGPPPAKKIQQQAAPQKKELPQWIPGNYGNNSRFSSRKMSPQRETEATPVSLPQRRSLTRTQQQQAQSERPLSLRDISPNTYRAAAPHSLPTQASQQQETYPVTRAPNGLTIDQLREALQAIPTPLRAQLMHPPTQTHTQNIASAQHAHTQRDVAIADDDDDRLRAEEESVAVHTEHQTHSNPYFDSQSQIHPNLASPPFNSNFDENYAYASFSASYSSPTDSYELNDPGVSNKNIAGISSSPTLSRRKAATPTQVRRVVSGAPSHTNTNTHAHTNAQSERGRERERAKSTGAALPLHTRTPSNTQSRTQSQSVSRARSTSLSRGRESSVAGTQQRETRAQQGAAQTQRGGGGGALEWSRLKAWDKHVTSAGFFTPAHSAHNITHNSNANTNNANNGSFKQGTNRPLSNTRLASEANVNNAPQTNTQPQPQVQQLMGSLEHYRQKKLNVLESRAVNSNHSQRHTTPPHNAAITAVGKREMNGNVFEYMQKQQVQPQTHAKNVLPSRNVPPPMQSFSSSPQRLRNVPPSNTVTAATGWAPENVPRTASTPGNGYNNNNNNGSGFTFQPRAHSLSRPPTQLANNTPHNAVSPQQRSPTNPAPHTAPSTNRVPPVISKANIQPHIQPQALLSQRPLSQQPRPQTQTQPQPQPAQVREPPRFSTQPQSQSHTRPQAQREPEAQRERVELTLTESSLSRVHAPTHSVTDAAEWQRLTAWLTQIGMAHTLTHLHAHGLTRLSEIELCDSDALCAMGLCEEDACCVVSKVRELTERMRCVSELAMGTQPHPLTHTALSKNTPTAVVSSSYPTTRTHSELAIAQIDEDELSLVSHAQEEGDHTHVETETPNLTHTQSTTGVVSHTQPLPTPALSSTQHNAPTSLALSSSHDVLTQPPTLVSELETTESERTQLRDALLSVFDNGALSLFVPLWARLGHLGTPGGLGDLDPQRPKLCEVKQAIELHLYVHFYVHAVRCQWGIEKVSQARDALRAYLERASRRTLCESDVFCAKKDGVSVEEMCAAQPTQSLSSREQEALSVSFTSSREFALYAGLVFVPTPQQSLAFRSLFTHTHWRDSLRDRLAQFLSLSLSLSSMKAQPQSQSYTEIRTETMVSKETGSLTQTHHDAPTKPLPSQNSPIQPPSSSCPTETLRKEDAVCDGQSAVCVRCERAPDAAPHTPTEKRCELETANPRTPPDASDAEAPPFTQTLTQSERERETPTQTLIQTDPHALSQLCLSPQSTSSSISQLTDDTSLRRLATPSHSTPTARKTLPENKKESIDPTQQAHTSLTPSLTPQTTQTTQAAVPQPPTLTQRLLSSQRSPPPQSNNAQNSVLTRTSPVSLQQQVDQYNRQLRRHKTQSQTQTQAQTQTRSQPLTQYLTQSQAQTQVTSSQLTPPPTAGMQPTRSKTNASSHAQSTQPIKAVTKSPSDVTERVNRYRALLNKNTTTNTKTETPTAVNPLAHAQSDAQTQSSSTHAHVLTPNNPHTDTPPSPTHTHTVDLSAIDAIVSRIVCAPRREEDWDHSERESDAEVSEREQSPPHTHMSLHAVFSPTHTGTHTDNLSPTETEMPVHHTDKEVAHTTLTHNETSECDTDLVTHTHTPGVLCDSNVLCQGEREGVRNAEESSSAAAITQETVYRPGSDNEKLQEISGEDSTEERAVSASVGNKTTGEISVSHDGGGEKMHENAEEDVQNEVDKEEEVAREGKLQESAVAGVEERESQEGNDVVVLEVSLEEIQECCSSPENVVARHEGEETLVEEVEESPADEKQQEISTEGTVGEKKEESELQENDVLPAPAARERLASCDEGENVEETQENLQITVQEMLETMEGEDVEKRASEEEEELQHTEEEKKEEEAQETTGEPLLEESAQQESTDLTEREEGTEKTEMAVETTPSGERAEIQESAVQEQRQGSEAREPQESTQREARESVEEETCEQEAQESGSSLCACEEKEDTGEYEKETSPPVENVEESTDGIDEEMQKDGRELQSQEAESADCLSEKTGENKEENAGEEAQESEHTQSDEERGEEQIQENVPEDKEKNNAFITEEISTAVDSESVPENEQITQESEVKDKFVEADKEEERKGDVVFEESVSESKNAAEKVQESTVGGIGMSEEVQETAVDEGEKKDAEIAVGVEDEQMTLDGEAAKISQQPLEENALDTIGMEMETEDKKDTQERSEVPEESKSECALGDDAEKKQQVLQTVVEEVEEKTVEERETKENRPFESKEEETRESEESTGESEPVSEVQRKNESIQPQETSQESAEGEGDTPQPAEGEEVQENQKGGEDVEEEKERDLLTASAAKRKKNKKKGKK